MGVDTSGNVSPINGRAATVNPIKIESGKSYYVKATGYNPKVIIAVWNGDTLVRRTVANPLDTELDVSGGTDLYVCVYENESTKSIVGVDENHLMVVTDNSITEYRPYSNICPISGHTGAEIQQRGKNLFDEVYNGISTSASPTYKAIYVGDGDYTLSTTTPLNTGGNTNLFLLPGNVSSGASSGTNGVSIGNAKTVTASDGYVTIAYRSYLGVNPQEYKTQLELGSTATAYEPYTGNQVSVTFPETIYGGSDEVISGKLKSTMGKIVLDANIPTGANGIRAITVLADGVRCEYYPYRAIGKGNNAAIISNVFKNAPIETGIPYRVANGSGDGRMFLSLPLEYDTEEKIRTYFASNPAEFVYYLNTPVEYTLTEEEMIALDGTNVIWANTGDVTVTYIAKSAKFSFGSPLRIYNYNNLKLFGNTYIEHGKG